MLKIGIVSRSSDLHMHAVKAYLDSRSDVECAAIETDMIAGCNQLVWGEEPGLLPCAGSEALRVDELDVLWFRRQPDIQRLPGELDVDPSYADVVNTDCEAALMGALHTEFTGTWVSEPEPTYLAENKLIQHTAAKAVGFRVPRTLVTQDAERVRRFYDDLRGEVIVKQIQGTPNFGGKTTMVSRGLLERADVISLAPAIYQEMVPGDRHLRVHCFGSQVTAVEIEASDLDWRFDLNVPMRQTALDQTTCNRMQAVLHRLRLRMGVFDFKRTPDGEIVWLEVNPQGQFLFIEGLTGAPLTSQAGDFLLAEGRKQRALRSAAA